MGSVAYPQDTPGKRGERMLGTITRFSKVNTSGAIRNEQGEHFDFDLAGVLTYDVAALAEGKFVHFQPAGRWPCKAINVSIEPPAAVHPGADRYKEITQLRYVGFRHLEDLRRFRFERITPGGPTQCFEVAANMALFHTLRIAIQEGPTLCMRVIAAELESGRKWEDLALLSLTEQHMRDYLSSKPAPGAKLPKAPRRPSVYSAPAPWS
jgi:hypothetical protein